MSELTHNEMLLCQAAAELMNGMQPDWERLGLPKYLRKEILERAWANRERLAGLAK
jgi:hypothetical protein